jgi:hypothetical protein
VEEAGTIYVCEPGPRVEGSWYVCVLRLEKRAEKRSFAMGFRACWGTILKSDGTRLNLQHRWDIPSPYETNHILTHFIPKRELSAF